MAEDGDMVERVARALGEASGYDWWGEPALVKTYGEAIVEDKRNECRGLAEVAVQTMHRGYYIPKPNGGWRDRETFTAAERKRLWPIAETLAMLDGNAFFIMGDEYQTKLVESYLPEAFATYTDNGGNDGWAGEAMLADKFDGTVIDAALATTIQGERE